MKPNSHWHYVFKRGKEKIYHGIIIAQILLWQSSYKNPLGAISEIMISCDKPMKFMITICVKTSTLMVSIQTHKARNGNGLGFLHTQTRPAGQQPRPGPNPIINRVFFFFFFFGAQTRPTESCGPRLAPWAQIWPNQIFF